ncbi:hypothetical protein [Sorangium sp. So ce1000]|uniref:hypothetical protein n=1 Tax=Sorangium sp. So ce1000 TaxID=3133325 RepID=UPI003F5E14DB
MGKVQKVRGRSAACGAPGAAAQLAADRFPAVARFCPALCAPGCAALVRRAAPRPARPPACGCLIAAARCGAARFAPALRVVFRPLAGVAPAVLRARPAAALVAVRFLVLVVAALLAAALRCRLACPVVVFLGVLLVFFFSAVVLRAALGRAAAPAPALLVPFFARVTRRVDAAAIRAPAVDFVRLRGAVRPASPWDVAGAACSRLPLRTRFLCLDVSFDVSPLGIEPSPELSRHELARGLMVPQPSLFPGRKVGGKHRNRNQESL